MQSTNPYFMVSVKVLEAQESLRRALESLEANLGMSAVAAVRKAQTDLADAMEQMYKLDVRRAYMQGSP